MAIGDRVNIPVVTGSRTAVEIGASSGASEVTGVPADDHYFYNDGSAMLLIRETASGAGGNVEVVIQQSVDGVTPAVKTYAVAADEHFIVGPFPPGFYNDEVGVVHVNTDTADISFQAFKTGDV